MVTEYSATVLWRRSGKQTYTDNKYSRGHEWHFDGGTIVLASSSPHIVPLPYSVESNVDPEEAFIASLSSCHMLFFLSIAAKSHFVVDEYIDHAIGIMEKGDNGRLAITRVNLRPKVKFSGKNMPTDTDLKRMHHEAHEQCFIANSVKAAVTTEIIPST